MGDKFWVIQLECDVYNGLHVQYALTKCKGKNEKCKKCLQNILKLPHIN